MTEYKYLRKRYISYIRLSYLLISMFFLCIVSNRNFSQYILYITIAYICIVVFVQKKIEKWYLKTLNKSLFVDINIASWQQFIQFNENAKSRRVRSKTVIFYQVNSELLSNKINSMEDIEKILKDSNINDSDMTEMAHRFEAILDIVIKKKANDYFKTLDSDFKFDILESMYFDALNEQLKGNEQKAKQILTDIYIENLDIFIVRKSKIILEEM